MVDTIFVSGLPEDIVEDGLVQHFGSIGVIKVRYFLYMLVVRRDVLWRCLSEVMFSEKGGGVQYGCIYSIEIW